MNEIIAIVSRKGGSAKTTTAQCLADGIRRTGASVLLIDLDSQYNLTTAMGADPAALNSTDLFEADAKPARLIQHTDNGDIIAGSPHLAAGDVILKDNNRLKQVIKPFAAMYDFIILDLPASYGRLVMNALNAATMAIITLEPATFSADGLAELSRIIKSIRKTNRKLQLRGILITRCDSRSNEAKRTIEEIREAAGEIGTEVLEPPIRSTAKVFEAQRRKVNLFDYAPKCTAALDYAAVTKLLLNQ